MIFYGKDAQIDPAKATGRVVYLWLGKMRWLPHIGAAYLVVGYRDSHLIAVAVNETNHRTGEKLYLHRADIALCCDPYDEYMAMQQMKSEYLKSRNDLDRSVAARMRKMGTKQIAQAAQTRRRTRPKGGLFYVPKTKAVTVASQQA